MLTMTRDRAPPVSAPVRDYTSFSAISTYQSCPLKYYFRYLANQPQESIAASLVFGSALHRAVQVHFEELLADGPAPSLDELLDVFQAAWREQETVPLQYGMREDFDTYCEMADRLLDTFLQSDWAQPTGRILGVEEELRGPVVPGCPELLGRIDLVVDTGDALTVTDFKTARSTWSDEHVQDAGTQLLLYQELVRPLAQDKPVRLQFAVLTKAKSPELSLLPVYADQHQLERTRRIVRRIWQAIQSGHFYPSPSPVQCPSCPFRSACRRWSGE